MGLVAGAARGELVRPDGRRVPLLAYYYGWYAAPHGPSGAWRGWGKEQGGRLAPDGTDPDQILFEPGLRNIASAAYPLIGPYDSRSREVARWHIRLAKAAGIDGFLVSWWGPGGWQKPPGLTEKAFIEALLPAAEEEGFKVALFDELPQFFGDLEQVAQWAAEYLGRFARSPAYLRIDGRPVYGLYQLWQGKMSPEECRRLQETVEREVGEVYWLVTKMRCRPRQGMPQNLELFFPDEWLALDSVDALGGYSVFGNMRAHTYDELSVLYRRIAASAHEHGRQVLLPVHPGHNNGKFSAEPYVMPRDGGATLSAYLRAALEAEADLVAVTSFNEWPETTVVEPSLTWPDPYRYLKILAVATGRTWRPPPLPPADQLDPLIRPYLPESGALRRGREEDR